MMPRWIIFWALIIASLLCVPPFLFAMIRSTQSAKRPVHIVHDMDFQPRFNTQTANPIFMDDRAMRPPVPGVVARGEVFDDSALYGGAIDGEWITELPEQFPMSMDLLNRGRERYNIFCSACHGFDGSGGGIVNLRAIALRDNSEGPVDETTWTEAKNLHDPTVSTQPIGEIYNTLTNGKNTMAGYGPQVPLEDRWAIAAYVKVLQRSQDAKIQDVPPDRRAEVMQ